jgi:beta-glucosidase
LRPDEFVNPEAKDLAAKADIVIVAAGFSPETETEGADRTFGLPPGQDELINAALDANKNTFVVLTSGGGMDMNAWVDRAPAILQAWYAGQEGGTALAQLLYGDVAPSGKLPMTFERRWEDNPSFKTYYPDPSDKAKKISYTEGVFIGYRGYEKNGTKPLFPFGHGLSYTTFAYKNLSVTPAEVAGDAPVTVSFEVTNTGQREGAEVAQVYVGDKHSKVPRPAKELKGFSKVSLKPGETKRVQVQLDRRAFSYYDVNKKSWTADPGAFQILVGPSSAEIALNGIVTLN